MVRRLRARIRWRGDRGATAVEYALTVVLVAVVILIAAALLGQNSKQTFDCTRDSVAAQQNRC